MSREPWFDALPALEHLEAEARGFMRSALGEHEKASASTLVALVDLALQVNRFLDLEWGYLSERERSSLEPVVQRIERFGASS